MTEREKEQGKTVMEDLDTMEKDLQNMAKAYADGLAAAYAAMKSGNE